MTGRGWLGLLVAALLFGAGAFIWMRAEGSAPTVEGPAELLVGGDKRVVTLDIADAGSGLREIRVSVQQADNDTIAFERVFPGSWTTGSTAPPISERVEVEIDPKALGLVHGEATLTVTVRDWSWRNSFRGNETQHQTLIGVDLKKPRIRVASGLTYVSRGGSGAVVYTLGEPCVRDGVTVGSTFYRGYPAPGEPASSDRRFALFAIPTDIPKNPRIEVIAEDRAGNVGRSSWPVVMKERVLPEANVTLPNRFMETKVRQLADAQGFAQDDLNATFDRINTELRSANEAKIAEIVSDSSETKLWNGAFTQLRNSKVTSRFAERRSYFVDGQQISKATHFGYDLASTSGAPIHASNSGNVVFADELGIYGDCVIIDHGLGLFSLYAHLSSLGVSVGDQVEQGSDLGLSGETGLAGGDHLHFALIVGGTYVDPLEWWDPVWVRTHVEARLAPSKQ